MSEKACEGGRTVADNWHDEMQECLHCGTSVRWDLVDHKFFGFQNCREKGTSLAAVDPVVANSVELSTREKKE